MRLTGIGSQYLMTVKDADGNRLDGAKNYRVTLPPGHPGGTILVDHPLRQRDALDAPDAAALPAGRQPVLPDAGRDRERRRVDDHHVRPRATRRTAPRATGSRRPKARAGSRSSASTAHSRRSSTRPGARARSRPSRRQPRYLLLECQRTTERKGTACLNQPATPRSSTCSRA